MLLSTHPHMEVTMRQVEEAALDASEEEPCTACLNLPNSGTNAGGKQKR